MPVVAIQPNQRMSFPYAYPIKGKVRITVEASVPVDIFVCRQADESYASSVVLAAARGIFTLPQRKMEEQTLTIPDDWRFGSWVLVIANSSPAVAAVHYTVYSV